MSIHDPARYPNLFQVAREISRCKDQDRVLNALLAMLTSNPGLMKGGTQDG